MTTENSRPTMTSGRAANEQNDVRDRVTLPAARANAGPPVRGRGMWAITVLACTCCGAMHQHRAGDPSALLHGRTVRTCPATGERYRLAPVRRWREARRG